ncbi:MAG: helix-turn-helix domain-containing protein [Oscillospiraceae bacterium]
MTMDELKLIVASKLIKLRQEAGFTQAELGEKLNYSDKTVSKWERGESLPDAFVLLQIAQIYGTTVDALLSEQEPWQDPVKKAREEEKKNAPKFSSTVVTLVAIAGIWTMAVILYVTLWIAANTHLWMIFVTAVPISLITLLVLNSVWNKGRHNQIIVMLLVACIIALLYLFLLPFNPWQLFLILIPAEIMVFLCFHIRIPSRKSQK